MLNDRISDSTLNGSFDQDYGKNQVNRICLLLPASAFFCLLLTASSSSFFCLLKTAPSVNAPQSVCKGAFTLEAVAGRS